MMEKSSVFSTRRFKLGDAFFHDGDHILYNAQNKQSTFDIDSDEFAHRRVSAFSCHIAGCMTTFHSVREYEVHYNSLHRHVCNECKKLFPTNHLLEIHTLEVHDVLFQMMAEKQSMHQCFVEGCLEKFRNTNDRKEHLIKFHHYPHDFRFARQRKEKTSDKKVDTSENHSHVESMQITYAESEVSTLKGLNVKYVPKIPKSICFGQGTSRGFMPRGRGMHSRGKRKGKHWHQTLKDEDMDTNVSIEDVTFKDLCESLPSEDS